MNQALGAWRRMERMPLGKWLFSRAICWKAPYFASIAPTFEELGPGQGMQACRATITMWVSPRK